MGKTGSIICRGLIHQTWEKQEVLFVGA